MKVTTQATAIVTALQEKLALSLGGVVKENTALNVAKDLGLITANAGKFGGVFATVEGMAFAGLTGEIADNPNRLAAAVKRAAEKRTAAEAAFAAAQEALKAAQEAEATLVNA